MRNSIPCRRPGPCQGLRKHLLNCKETARQEQVRDRAAGRNSKQTFVTYSFELGSAMEPAMSQTQPCPPGLKGDMEKLRGSRVKHEV